MLPNVIVPRLEVNRRGTLVSSLRGMLEGLFGVRFLFLVGLGGDRLAAVRVVDSARLFVAAGFRRIQPIVVMLAFLRHALQCAANGIRTPLDWH